MKIPKYVQELMERSRYEYVRCSGDPRFAVGYTLAIKKRSPMSYISTLEKELDRLCRWADRAAGCETAHILSIPDKTHYVDQSAVVTIFDPVMKHIEKYIPKQ